MTIVGVRDDRTCAYSKHTVKDSADSGADWRKPHWRQPQLTPDAGEASPIPGEKPQSIELNRKSRVRNRTTTRLGLNHFYITAQKSKIEKESEWNRSHSQAKVKLDNILERVSTVPLDGNGGEGGRLEGDYLDDLFAVILSIEIVSNYD